jgi:hypothetical protein
MVACAGGQTPRNRRIVDESSKSCSVVAVVATFVTGSVAFAGTYIYPKKGQSKQQQDKDKGAYRLGDGSNGLRSRQPAPASGRSAQAPPPHPASSGSIRLSNALRGRRRGALGAIGRDCR